VQCLDLGIVGFDDRERLEISDQLMCERDLGVL
jgi:hypothetical protein